jgi:hypothetical protein
VIGTDAWHPIWSPDGKSIIYREASGREPGGPLLSATIAAERGFSIGQPVPVVTGLRSRGRVEREYDIMPDGKRFIGISSSSVRGERADAFRARATTPHAVMTEPGGCRGGVPRHYRVRAENR